MTGRICWCAMGCAENRLADRGVFGESCSCWCHQPKNDAEPE
jgi:hypothetical protein